MGMAWTDQYELRRQRNRQKAIREMVKHANFIQSITKLFKK